MKSNDLNDLFDYDFKIYQNDKYFKFSIDSVLLAEFVQIKKNDYRIIDFCTGNAPVPMILSKKNGNNIMIKAIEVQEPIYNLAIQSLQYNKIENIEIIHTDILSFVSSNREKYDIVTCNPPYFKVSDNKIINDNKIKAIARHEILITLEEIISSAAKVLKNKGYFYMVHRPERLADIINSLKKERFGLKRIQTVYNDKNSTCCFILIEAIYNGEDYVKIDKPVYLEDYKSYQDLFRR